MRNSECQLPNEKNGEGGMKKCEIRNANCGMKKNAEVEVPIAE